jgi:hypothetical protein
MSGGARKNSGPRLDPNSGRSERRGIVPVTPTALPMGGFDGPIPDFSLPFPEDRELALWGWLWRTPQAAMWAAEPWRQLAVAQYARQAARFEVSESPGISAQMVRLSDQIGLSPDGMRMNGWAVAKDELAAQAVKSSVPPLRRMRAVS